MTPEWWMVPLALFCVGAIFCAGARTSVYLRKLDEAKTAEQEAEYERRRLLRSIDLWRSGIENRLLRVESENKAYEK